ncbi:DNA polymerase III subunit beta [Halobacteriales archaeon QS_9_67_17]|nr:MAG: DNA polymerase III subunit beta [Halobacteriales archaeon QS_9_67_17]
MRARDPEIDGVDTDGMQAYLSGTEVVFAVLFGSRATGDATDASDVDIALRFPGRLDAHERFRRRNRIDAELQTYADGFVDVSDIVTLPTPVARAALHDGVRLVGDETEVAAYHERVDREYESTTAERGQDELIRRLADGDA